MIQKTLKQSSSENSAKKAPKKSSSENSARKAPKKSSFENSAQKALKKSSPKKLAEKTLKTPVKTTSKPRGLTDEQRSLERLKFPWYGYSGETD